MINLDDFMNLINPPSEVDVRKINKYLFYPRLFESRLVAKKEDNVWFISKGRGFNYGIQCNWKKKDYLRKFLLEIDDILTKEKKIRLKDFIKRFELSFSEEKFTECYQSIPRLQDDKEILERIETETEKFFDLGYSSFLAYVMFRVYINKMSKPSQILFQKALNRAINIVYLPFETWIKWRKNDQKNLQRRLQYYELDENVRRFADNVRNEMVRKCYVFLSSFYPEGCRCVVSCLRW